MRAGGGGHTRHLPLRGPAGRRWLCARRAAGRHQAAGQQQGKGCVQVSVHAPDGPARVGGYPSSTCSPHRVCPSLCRSTPQREDYPGGQQGWYLLQFRNCSGCSLSGGGVLDGGAQAWVVQARAPAPAARSWASGTGAAEQRQEEQRQQRRGPGAWAQARPDADAPRKVVRNWRDASCAKADECRCTLHPAASLLAACCRSFCLPLCLAAAVPDRWSGGCVSTAPLTAWLCRPRLLGVVDSRNVSIGGTAATPLRLTGAAAGGCLCIWHWKIGGWRRIAVLSGAPPLLPPASCPPDPIYWGLHVLRSQRVNISSVSIWGDWCIPNNDGAGGRSGCG